MRVFAGEPGCTLVAEQEEGPYYVPAAKLRRVLNGKQDGRAVAIASAGGERPDVRATAGRGVRYLAL
jgi:hypothetical protein